MISKRRTVCTAPGGGAGEGGSSDPRLFHIRCRPATQNLNEPKFMVINEKRLFHPRIKYKMNLTSFGGLNKITNIDPVVVRGKNNSSSSATP